MTTDIKEDISKMSNGEIKDKILDLNKKQLKLIKDSSYLNAINGINALKKELADICQNHHVGLASETNLLEYYINKNINLLNNKDSLEESLNIREEIYGLSTIIDGYSIELNYVGELVDQQGIKLISKKDYKDIPYNPKKVEETITIVNSLLDKAKDSYHKYIYIISQIVLILPMRVTKENYFNIIKNTLMRNLRLHSKDEVDNVIGEYKKQFDSSLRDGYGTKFDYYFREIQKLRNVDLSNKEITELDHTFSEIMNLTKEINQIFDFILRLGLISNMIIAINLIDDISCSEEVVKILNGWTQTLYIGEQNSLDHYTDAIEKEIKKIEESMLSDIEEFNLLNTEALSRADFDYDELNSELSHAKKVLTYYNDATLLSSNVLFPENSDRVSPEYLEQLVDSLIQYINRALSKMGNVERKARMRKLLSKIELPFDGIEEFNNYIRYALDNKVLDKKEINFTLDYILYFLESLIKDN